MLRGPWRRRGPHIVTILLSIAAFAAYAPRPAAAQDCPTAQSGARGFVVERNETQKTEVFHAADGIVRTVMRFDGKTLLETTRIRGPVRPWNGSIAASAPSTKPSTELKALFPLKPGQQARAKFITERDGKYGVSMSSFEVKKPEDLYIGPCKYSVLRIDHSEEFRTARCRRNTPSPTSTRPISSSVLGREYKKRGQIEVIKFDRIYPIKN